MGNIVNISLAEMTRERMHELYRGFSLDPIIFEELLPGVEYTYRPEKVDALVDMRKREENSAAEGNLRRFVMSKAFALPPSYFFAQ